MLQGQRLYLNSLVSGGLGFITFGWDAGVLGGVLLTPSFQSAMGVRTICSGGLTDDRSDT